MQAGALHIFSLTTPHQINIRFLFSSCNLPSVSRLISFLCPIVDEAYQPFLKQLLFMSIQLFSTEIPAPSTISTTDNNVPTFATKRRSKYLHV